MAHGGQMNGEELMDRRIRILPTQIYNHC